MKRLIKKSSLNKVADWQPVDPNSEDIVQVITNCMANSEQIQIEYQGSGWRTILPYGWNTSKDSNILLMCYKDTQEVRSYRLDRISQVLVDIQEVAQNDDIYEIEDYSDPLDFEIPELPNMDEIIEETENEIGEKSPFSEGIEYILN